MFKGEGLPGNLVVWSLLRDLNTMLQLEGFIFLPWKSSWDVTAVLCFPDFVQISPELVSIRVRLQSRTRTECYVYPTLYMFESNS